MKIKKKFVRILFCFYFLALSFVVLELGARLFLEKNMNFFFKVSTGGWNTPGVQNKDFFNRSNFFPSKSLGYEPAPHSKLGTNSLGMFDKERRKEKSRDCFRIICLGDSTTANSVYAASLEALLNKSAQPGKFEVWNCGVPGYGLIQYCRYMEEKWLDYGPDMVILGFCLNDFEATPLVIREKDRLVGYFPSREVFPKVNLFLFRNSAVYRFMILRKLVPGADDRADILTESSRSLGQLRQLLKKKNIPLAVVILGLPRRLENYGAAMTDSYDEIMNLCREYGIDCIDTIPVFENNDPENLRLLANDAVHFNEKASSLIAGAVFTYLENRLPANE